jgi:hypothetical protein
VDPTYIPWGDFSRQFVQAAAAKKSMFDFNPLNQPKGDGQIVSAVFKYAGSNAAYKGLFAYMYQVQVFTTASTNDVENLVVNFYSKFAQFGNGNLNSSVAGNNPLFPHAVDPTWLLTYSPNGDGNGLVYQISPTLPGAVTGTKTSTTGVVVTSVGPGKSWATVGGNGSLPSNSLFTMNNIEDTEESGGVDLNNANAQWLASNPGQSAQTGVLNQGDSSSILVFFSYSPWTFNQVNDLQAHTNGVPQNLPSDGITPSVYEPMPEPGAIALCLVGGFGLLGAGAYRRLRFRRALA